LNWAHYLRRLGEATAKTAAQLAGALAQSGRGWLVAAQAALADACPSRGRAESVLLKVLRHAGAFDWRLALGLALTVADYHADGVEAAFAPLRGAIRGGAVPLPPARGAWGALAGGCGHDCELTEHVCCARGRLFGRRAA
jgi:hypothetical protein